MKRSFAVMLLWSFPVKGQWILRIYVAACVLYLLGVVCKYVFVLASLLCIYCPFISWYYLTLKI